MRQAVSNAEFVEWVAYFNMLAQREELQRLVDEARAKRAK